MKRKRKQEYKDRENGQERAKTKVWNGEWQKKILKNVQIWLEHVHQIKIFHISVQYLGEIYQFHNKIPFSVKPRPI